MSKISEETLVISRGMALHKLIRLITLALGGEVFAEILILLSRVIWLLWEMNSVIQSGSIFQEMAMGGVTIMLEEDGICLMIHYCAINN